MGPCPWLIVGVGVGCYFELHQIDCTTTVPGSVFGQILAQAHGTLCKSIGDWASVVLWPKLPVTAAMEGTVNLAIVWCC